MFGITSWKLLILLVAAMVLIGPERLPEYVAKGRTYIRQARDMANGAKGTLTDQLKPDFHDIDWRQYDPRQYDPRKIIRDALLDDEETPTAEEPMPETIFTITTGSLRTQHRIIAAGTPNGPHRTTPKPPESALDETLDRDRAR